MNSAKPTVLSIAITFLVAAAFYFVAYSWLSKKQAAKGPWQVLFTNGVAGPALVVSQPNLGLSNVTIVFGGETLASTQRTGVVQFSKPHLAIPFGSVVFDDLMFQPGTVTLDCFGHEVELLPRVLVLDRKQVPWASNSTNVLIAASKLPPEQLQPKKQRRK